MERTIKRNGKIAILRVARKEHRCSECPHPILGDEHYFEITYCGAGVRSSVYPTRTHVGDCVQKCLDRR